MRSRGLVAAAALALALAGAGCAATVQAPVDPVAAARRDAADSSDGELLGRWLLTELVAPGGSAQHARDARARLDGPAKGDKGVYASLARGLDDEAHGAMTAAASAYLSALDAASVHDGPEREILAWFAATRLIGLRGDVANLWRSARPTVLRLIDQPSQVGPWARAQLVDWWHYEERRTSGVAAKLLDAQLVEKLGCLTNARFAGPFGRAVSRDVVTVFDAEKPGVWPLTFPGHPSRAEAPRVLAADGAPGGCVLKASETTGGGVHYVETFFELDHAADVVLSVRLAWSVRVDDSEVLAHDPRDFGSKMSSDVALRLGPGRHRVVARLVSPETVIRLTDLGGRPLGVASSADPSKPIALEPPRVLPSRHPLAPFFASSGVKLPRGVVAPASALDAQAPVLRFMAAELAHLEQQHDVATVFMEPLVKEPTRATPIALAHAAMYIAEDPIFAQNDARDLALDFRRRAVDKDARLWFPQLWLMLDAATKQGEKDQLAPLAQLAIDFPEVATVGKALAEIYSRLGYVPEHKRTVVELAKRFPEDLDILRSYVTVLDEEGKRPAADEIAKRILTLQPDSSITVERAIAKSDFVEAARLLGELAEQTEGQTKKALLKRVAELLVRSGNKPETLADLERALADDPKSGAQNLSLADARLAGGDHAALRAALAHALRVGADASELRSALELVDGVTELEPFRLDPLEAIREFEQSGAAARGLAKTKGGTATRVLDYAAVWVHADGSARMLEHEILCMQSAEAIVEHTEQKIPRGKLLRMRVISKDGAIHEPEIVADKPTATMAPLGVGDYIETETVYEFQSDGNGGASYVSPRWFFREERIDYHRSEFLVIAPTDKPVVVETTGNVTPPKIEQLGPFTVRRWRMDDTPAVKTEPNSAPIAEFLPSVRAGWGVSQATLLSKLADAWISYEPADPRLVRIAKTVVTAGAPLDKQEAELANIPPVERARRLYRWVLDNIEPSRESDPRRIVVGKSGNRLEAFLYLARLAGVDARPAVVQDRLRPPPIGPFAEAELFNDIAVAIPTGQGTDVWTVVAEKYAPFGYLPSSLRGQPAVILREGLPRVVTGTGGPPDGVAHHGKAVLATDGSARLSLKQSYTGRLAIVLREEIQKLSDDDKLRVAVESQLLAGALPGARLAELKVVGLTDLDAPLVLELEVEVSSFAQKGQGVLVVPPPFTATTGFGQLAALERRETPLMFPGGAALRIEVDITIELPKGATTDAPPAAQKKVDDNRMFSVDDTARAGAYVVKRVIDLPAGRVQPSSYPAFVDFARAADEALHRDIVVRLP